MKKILFSLLFLLIPFYVNASGINIYLFYGDGCSHCAALEKYLAEQDDINVYKYEIWFNNDNEKLWDEVQKITKVDAKGVPYYIIGNKTLQGYNDNDMWKQSVDNAIENAKNESYDDEVGVYLGKVLEKDKSHKGTEIEPLPVDNGITDKTNDKVKHIIIAIAFIDVLATVIYLYKNTKKKL